MPETKEQKSIVKQVSAAKAESETSFTDQTNKNEPRRELSSSVISVAVLATLAIIGTIGYNLSYLKELINPSNTKNAGKLAATANSKAAKTVGVVSKTELPDGTEINFSYIPAGSFELGSAEYDNEKPIHKVEISRDFWMGQTEVSQKQWKSLMGALPSECDYGVLKGDFLGDKKPIICVSWEDAQNFVSKLNQLNDGYKYRLPTEAEWEYAARAGNTENFVENADTAVWYGRNSSGYIHDVGLVKPNAWNLYDMHGNVREWCQDWFGDYPKEAVTDPTGAENGSTKVIRGSWFASLTLRYGARSSDSPTARYHNLGFRVIRQ